MCSILIKAPATVPQTPTPKTSVPLQTESPHVHNPDMVTYFIIYVIFLHASDEYGQCCKFYLFPSLEEKRKRSTSSSRKPPHPNINPNTTLTTSRNQKNGSVSHPFHAQTGVTYTADVPTVILYSGYYFTHLK